MLCGAVCTELVCKGVGAKVCFFKTLSIQLLIFAPPLAVSVVVLYMRVIVPPAPPLEAIAPAEPPAPNE